MKLTKEEFEILMGNMVKEGLLETKIINGEPHYRLTPKGHEENAKRIAKKLQILGFCITDNAEKIIQNIARDEIGEEEIKLFKILREYGLE